MKGLRFIINAYIIRYYIKMANQELKLKEIQERGFCNWCRNPLAAQTEAITDKNFIDTGKSFGDGEKGYAVYCSECIGNEMRKSQPKSAINKKTLAEVNIESLLESKEEAKAVQKDREETLKATGTTSTADDERGEVERARSNKSKSK